MDKYKNKKYILIVLVVICICAVGYVAYLMADKNASDKIKTGGVSQDSDTDKADSTNYITYEGEDYEYNPDLKNILFIGVDKKEEVSVNDIDGVGGQADSIILLVMNTKDKTVKMIQISRDAMTDIELYDVNGKYYTTERAQIALQYAFGNGEKKSCWLMQNAVSRLFYDLPIESYISLNIEGIGILNAAVGGVTITVPEDYTAIDAAFEKDATITLSDELAEKYVRTRDTSVTGSNNERMRRQIQFLQAFASVLRETMNKNPSFYLEVMPKVTPYMVTDMDTKQIENMSDYQFLSGETQIVPGEVKQGEIFDEYHVNDEKLYDLIIKTFYKKIN